MNPCCLPKPLLVLFVLTTFSASAWPDVLPWREDVPAALEDSRQAPAVLVNPGPEYSPEFTQFVGCPSVEVSPGGRLWASWLAGGLEESRYNYVAVNTSGDGGETWSDLKLVVDPGASGPASGFHPEKWRTSHIGQPPLQTENRYACLPVLWHDPQGRLWLFWSQRNGGMWLTWAMTTEDSDRENPVWSLPRPIGEGLVANKPTVLSTGEWLLPLQYMDNFVSPMFSTTGPYYDRKYFDYSAALMVSRDSGKTFEYLGAANIPEESWRAFDEHMVVELRDGRLWMLLRLHSRAGGYIGQSYSSDRGKTWTPVELSSIRHTSARFHLRRLSSGDLLLLKHGPIAQGATPGEASGAVADDAEWTLVAAAEYNPKPFGYERNTLMAFLSADDGENWEGGMIIDERHRTYPDAVEGEDGTLYVIYDSRHSADGRKGVYLSQFNPSDIQAGVSMRLDGVGLQSTVTRAGGLNLKRPDMGIRDNSDGVSMVPPDSALLEPQDSMVSRLVVGVELFIDRPYTVLQVPMGLYGRSFLRSGYDGVQTKVLQSGMVYALTPSGDRNQGESQDRQLRDQGFEKVAVPDAALFLPYGTPQRYDPQKDASIVTTWQKKATEGEVIELGSWGILVF